MLIKKKRWAKTLGPTLGDLALGEALRRHSRSRTFNAKWKAQQCFAESTRGPEQVHIPKSQAGEPQGAK
jgi:hypothetical protein